MKQEDLIKSISMWMAESEKFRADRPGFVYELEAEQKTPKTDYSEMYGALRDLNGALTCLLRLNWIRYPWSKEVYYDLCRLNDILCERVYKQNFTDKIEINQKHDES